MYKSKKYIFGFIILLVIILISAAYFYKKNSDKDTTINLILAETNEEDYVTTVADEYFADLVSNRSHGRIKIKVCANSELGDETAVVSGVQTGSIDFGRISVAPLSEYVDEFNVLLLPYLFKTDEQMQSSLNGNLGAVLKQKMDEHDISLLAWYYSGSRSFYTKNKISGIEDLQNQKIRVQNSSLMFSMCETLGCIPSFYNEALIADMVRIGELDGAENNLLIYYTYKQYEQCPYYIEDEHCRIPDVLIASKKSMSDLSDDDVALIEDCAKTAAEYEIKLWQEKELEVKKLLKDRNVTIIPVSSEEKSEMVNRFAILYEEFGNDYSELIDF